MTEPMTGPLSTSLFAEPEDHMVTAETTEPTPTASRLVGRTAVITGGCSGIGLATARRFAAEGAFVVIGDVDDARGPDVAEEVRGRYVHVDVTQADEVGALFAAAHAERGRIDVAFNNAGINPTDDASILDTGLEAWRRVQEVNLTSVYLCCKAVLPYMRAQRRGSIINTASFVAVMGAATSQISYSASKGGVLSMTRELGVEFAREGIRINALCPGPVNTPLLAELFASDPARAARRLVHVPMGRFAEPEEIAAAAAFLASDDSSFMTASSFLVDGGISGAYVTPV
jgi:NAD(P)-dependent dehydrogenase (short-subunit alcohol dehydrogenase family)